MPLSLEAKIIFAWMLALLLATATIAALSLLQWPQVLTLSLGLLVALPLGLAPLLLVTKSLNRSLRALETGLLNFKDNDFSTSLAVTRRDELGQLAVLYNQASDLLRRERQQLYQRELLLDMVVQSSPMAMLLVDNRQHIVYANLEARHLLNGGKPLQGLKLPQALGNSHAAIRELINSGRDGLVTLDIDAQSHTYHLSRGQFVFNTQQHQLYLFKQMTRDINRREVDIWKKVIRLISHELNNSLAPISSMAHSGKVLVNGGGPANNLDNNNFDNNNLDNHNFDNKHAGHNARFLDYRDNDNTGCRQKPNEQKLLRIFDTISERAAHLSDFISGYARFAKLPSPRPDWIEWREFVEKLQLHTRFQLQQPLPRQPGWGDSAQLEQVLINLIKNAHEAGGAPEEVKLAIAASATAARIEVMDRGCGMPETVLKQALLPFYSTKVQGTGLGLALCHEVVDAHGGHINFHNREGGGLRVSLFLPLLPG